MTDKEVIIILENQLSIMSALQRFEYFIHQKEIEEDLSERIKDTQNILSNKPELKYDLIKYLKDRIKECESTIELLEGTNSHRISILQAQIKNYQDILERVKSGNYEI